MPSIYVTGDTHGQIDWGKLNMDNFPQQKNMTKEDIVIIAGDFGGVWDGAGQDRYTQRTYDDRNFTTAFVDGNHENHWLLNSFPVEEWHGGKVHRISDSIVHLMRGEIYDMYGKKVFVFGGADSIDKLSRRFGTSWWPEEIPSNAEMYYGEENLNRVGNRVDFVITHECPTKIYRKIYAAHKVVMPYVLTEYLQVLDEQIEYDKWYFGHHHIDKVIDEKHIALYQNVIKIV